MTRRASAMVLLVDADGVSRRFVEFALGPKAGLCELGFSIDGARDAAAALELLAIHVFDLIICDTSLPDMNGLSFFRRLQQETRLRGVPFVFFSADAKVATKTLALRAGVDDYLTKPCEPAELAARVEALINRERRRREGRRQRSYTLAGDFSTLPFPDLTTILQLSKRSGTLAVVGKSAVGELSFCRGEITHASYGNLTGTEAFYGMLREPSGQFEFSTTTTADSRPRDVAQSVTALLMEGARRLDETEGVESVRSSAIRNAPAPSSSPASALSAGLELIPALVPIPGLVSQLEHTIRDGYTLGELRLWTHAELQRWCRAAGGRDRLHVFLLADLPAGVSSMLSVAAPPAERWALDALSPAAKVLGLNFFLRQERLIDVVLIDIRNPGAVEASLERRPAFAILAPPDGDALAIETRARVELARLLHKLEPRLVLGIGNASLESMLKEVIQVPANSSALCCRKGQLGEGQSDLRSVLADGLQTWGALAQSAGTYDLKRSTGSVA